MRFEASGAPVLDTAKWRKLSPEFSLSLEKAFQRSDFSAFEPTPDAFSLWNPFLFEAERRKSPALKAQIAGPITARLALTFDHAAPTSEERALIYGEINRFILARSIAMVRGMKKTGAQPVFFVDEPSLALFDSKDPMHRLFLADLEFQFAALKKEGALVGIHCCANTEWPMLLKCSIDLLAIDCALSLKSLLEAREALSLFAKRGGHLVLGVISTNDAQATDIENELPQLKAAGFQSNQLLYSAACGLAFLDVEKTETVLAGLKTSQSAIERAITA